MSPRYGIDTSILVRLLTGDPATDYQKTVTALERILADDYQHHSLITLTNERKMAALPQARKL